MSKVVAIIQARMGSTRLPGKVLKEILGRPLLSYMIERLKGSRRIEEIVIATPEGDPDRPIWELAEGLGVASFAGSEADVLDRYYHATRQFGADPIVRLTADCPLIDPEEDLSEMRWTVDDERDLRLITEIFRGLYREGEIFGMADILRFLRERPALLEINRGTIRNEGYLKSLREEGEL